VSRRYYTVFYKFRNKGILKDLNTHSTCERLFECRAELVTPLNKSRNNKLTELTLQIETRPRHRNPIQKMAIMAEPC
jgi:uncharacterized protein (DUF488 family)